MAIRYYRWREAFHKEIWNADRHWYALFGQLATPRFQLGENVFIPPDALGSDDDRVVVVGYVVRLWEGDRVTVDWMDPDGLWERETFMATALRKVTLR